MMPMTTMIAVIINMLKNFGHLSLLPKNVSPILVDVQSVTKIIITTAIVRILVKILSVIFSIQVPKFCQKLGGVSGDLLIL